MPNGLRALGYLPADIGAGGRNAADSIASRNSRRVRLTLEELAGIFESSMVIW